MNPTRMDKWNVALLALLHTEELRNWNWAVHLPSKESVMDRPVDEAQTTPWFGVEPLRAQLRMHKARKLKGVSKGISNLEVKINYSCISEHTRALFSQSFLYEGGQQQLNGRWLSQCTQWPLACILCSREYFNVPACYMCTFHWSP